MLKFLIRASIAIPLLLIAAIAGTLAFTAPKTPPAIAAVEKANDPFAAYARALPTYRYFTARDGTRLAYHYYPGKPGGGVAVVVHGSSGTSLAVHGLATAYAASGITVYAPDLRGHGMSPGPNGRLGDVVYRGQYEDDLADLADLIQREHPGEKRLLVGHSMGGAVILRTAASRYAGNFNGYLALAPFIAPNTPMDRPGEGGWTVVSVPRIVVLSILNGFGISALDHLNVLAMAVPPNAQHRPRFYTHALLSSSNLQRQWKAQLAAIHAPTRVLIGANDELFHAEAYPPAFKAVNPAIPVTVLPGQGHMTLMFDTKALAAETDAAVEMLK
ncbi:hypothetical protein AEAC466_01135 [Asticcacaulis sp. AC466]|uniref:alpha/beta hydrolase n=1 Tax=Asticcacaulis sp. AC466 TaxID=1282362 RepID=UPI0003C3C3EB|nr:alpha/beta fold hydrolase [Asticcacaulis sp. AC466]ESQ85809.1 hypothetical protein AEAC466_01135 [Asticcacaulis sp. AC466]